MPAYLENSAVATGLEMVSFHYNLKERQCQRMLKLPHNCVHLTCDQSNAQNSSSQASSAREQRTSKFQMFKLDLEKPEEPEIKLPTFVGSQKKQESSREISTSISLSMLKPLTVWITKNYRKFVKR